MNLNKAFILGRVTRDPEIRTTTTGQNVAQIGVATNRFYKNQQGERQEVVEFHNVVAWGRLSEIVGQYLKKGQLVLFEGRIQTRSWDGQDGVKRWRTEIVAESMQLGPKAGESGGGGQQRPNSGQKPAAKNQEEEIPTIQTDEAIPDTQEEKNQVDVDNIPF